MCVNVDLTDDCYICKHVKGKTEIYEDQMDFFLVYYIDSLAHNIVTMKNNTNSTIVFVELNLGIHYYKLITFFSKTYNNKPQMDSTNNFTIAGTNLMAKNFSPTRKMSYSTF